MIEPNSLHDALVRVIDAADLDIPMDARTMQTYLRNRADQLCTALQEMIEEIPADHLQDVKSRWQYAQVMSSMWQLVAYAVGQPMALEYVASAFEAASRRAMALADLVSDIAPPTRHPLPEPVLISDAVETMLKDIANESNTRAPEG